MERPPANQNRAMYEFNHRHERLSSDRLSLSENLEEL
jgi:hypothetical protein